MNHKTFIISIISLFTLNCCQSPSSEQERSGEIIKAEIVSTNPLDELEQVDNLLLELAEKQQRLTAPSDKETILTGAKGTIIHVDPNRLETVDGSPIGDNIELELLEMTDNSSLLLNNAQTVSNGQILITGGAYYVNMTSDGKQLRLKQGKALELEFPKLTDDEMGLFLGDRDSLGQMNWIPTESNFKSKKIENAKEPEKPIKKKEVFTEVSIIPLGEYNVDTTVIGPKKVNSEDVTEEEYQEYLIKLQEYEELKKEIEYQRQTYQVIKLMNFGWINCDRFYTDPNPKTDIQLLVNKDSLHTARFYAVFKDIRSFVTEYFYKGRREAPTFRNIPIGKELTIIAISGSNDSPYVFETTINTMTDQQVKIEFTATTQAELKEKIEKLNL